MSQAKLELKRRRLRMAASRRGFLETELALKPFVQRELGLLAGAELDEFERLLEMEDLDLWEVLAGRKQPPDGVSPGLMAKIRSRPPSA